MITPDQNIITAATQAQAQAANPKASVWLAANAGTGKTYVLVQRLIRLLINDAHLNPASILALTYTNAAAQEMRDRLLKEVSPWQNKPIDDLRDTLAAILHRTPTPTELDTAQKLPLRLRSQNINAMTIHSFCQKVLQRFPIEAGLPPNFTLWANNEPKDALKNAQNQAILNLSHPEHERHWAFHFLTSQSGDQKLKDLMQAYIISRDKIQACLETPQFDQTLKQNLSIPQSASINTLLEQYATPVQPAAEFITFIQTHASIFREGTKTSQDWITLFDTLTNSTAQHQNWSDLFLTKSGTPKALSSIAPKSVMTQLPDNFADLVLEEQHKYEQPKNIYTYLFTKAFIEIGQETEMLYRQIKQDLGAVDFNDLIQHTESLLYKTDLKDWVRYRLDGGVKHLLLDETQDTNPIQWRIVKALMSDFFTGEGQHPDTPRTLFAVGDFKQSIFRFQGAETQVFEDIKSFLTDAQNLGYTTETNATLNTSFRSVETILQAVDDVFTQPFMAEKTSIAGQSIQHISARTHQPGHVELWAPVAPPEIEQPEPWTLPQHRPQTATADKILCQNIAAEIKRLIQSNAEQDALIVRNKQGIATHRRTPQLSDFLLLIQSRTVLAELTTALTKEHIPYIAPNPSDPKDTFNLSIPRDLLALLQFIHQPHDDVALLTTLRSPLFSYSEEQTLSLLKTRTDTTSLWDTLSPDSPEKIKLQALHTHPTTSPYALLLMLNQQENLAHVLAQNMGGSDHAQQEANLVYQSFLNQAQQHKTLASYLTQLTEHGLSIIRPEQNDHTQPAVRIMTAHGSKGLEAPIVFLVDAGKHMFQAGQTPLLSWGEHQFIVRQSESQSTTFQHTLDDQEKQNTLQDNLRLLYVAMTRASEKLYICASLQRKGLINEEALKTTDKATNLPKTWWGIIACAAEQQNWLHTPEGRYIKSNPRTHTLPEQENISVSQKALLLTPDWLFKTFESSPQKEETTQAQQEGTKLHKAIELYATQSPHIAHQFLDDNEDDILLLEALHTHLPWVFEHGQSEVPILTPTKIGLQKRVIDRLIITPTHITIIDFKSDHIIPDSIPPKYKTQLSIYEKAIKDLYPTHQITLGIVWLRAEKQGKITPYFQTT